MEFRYIASEVLLHPATLTLVFLAGFTFVFLYVINSFRYGRDSGTKHEKISVRHAEKKKVISNASSTKSKKKGADNKWLNREKQAFSHPWLLTSFKGHTGQVLDMDFSSNGKYLATCGDEDPDPGGVIADESSNKENSQPSSIESSPQTKGLSRRQRKNRRREDASPPDKKKQKPKKVECMKADPMPILRQYQKLNIPESKFVEFLHSYMITHEQMLSLGYPVETDNNQAVIFRSERFPGKEFDVNAKEFVPYKMRPMWNDCNGGQVSSSSSDSGEILEEDESSGRSSSVSSGACSSEESHIEQKHSLFARYDATNGSSFEIPCARCGSSFFLAKNEYLTHERCVFHWGRLHLRVQEDGSGLAQEFTCCRGKANTRGCTTSKLHVWNGVMNGLNGPFDDYIRTKSRRSVAIDGNYGVYALDCEMCYTARGLECTKVTVVGMDGRLVYNSFVRPENEIVDFNTRFSGITAKDLVGKNVKSLREVQNDLMSFISAKTILIGHALENDLRALRIVHGSIVDTAYSFPHHNGLPYKRSLKNLTSTILKRSIQNGPNGHDSYEDAASCMELMLWRVRKDFRHCLQYNNY